jgi:alanyl-tRNA synthetase
VTTSRAEVEILDAQKPTGDVIVHAGKVKKGTLSVGDSAKFEVDAERRQAIRGNHSATHLLHLALKKTLGDHVAQKGSLVAPDRLRFDFTHFSPMTAEQIGAVEDWVNREVLKNEDSQIEVLPIAEAKKRGAVAMFGEKYGDSVRVVKIGGESLEFCGGTHVGRAGDVGLFKILSESGIAQGVRRIEAVTGLGALAHLRRLERELADTGARLKVSPFQVSERVERLQQDMKKTEREVEKLKAKLAGGGSRDLMSDVTEINGIKVLATSSEVDDVKALRDTGDRLRDKLQSGIVILCGVGADKVALVSMVTKDLTDRFHAGRLLEIVAEVTGGKAGGRPDMAQGGGKDPAKVPEALKKVLEAIRSS